MASYPIPPDETERIRLLHALNLLDTPAEAVFDRITRLVAQTLKVPIALISLVDTDRQWFKSKVGLDTPETLREVAFCAHAIMHNTTMIVEDAVLDERFKNNPLVTGDPNIRFYAGVPLHTTGGLALGTLCAIDSKPRCFTDEETSLLEDLADLVNRELHLREAMLLTHNQVAHSAQAMDASEARFRTIFERAGVGIALLAPNGEWLSVNDELCQIVGYSQDELTRLSFQNITYSEDLDTDLNFLQQLADNKIDRFQREKRYVRKNGSIVWIHLTVTKQLNPQGELEYFISVVKDIQARKETEAALDTLRNSLEQQVEAQTRDLRTSNEMLSSTLMRQTQFEMALRKREAELRMVIENANDAYVCIDQDGIVSQWNYQAEITFGWTAQEAVGQELASMIIPPEQRAAHSHGMQRYLETGEAHILKQRLELQALHRNGHTLPVEVRVVPLFIDGKTIFSAFLHDITERKQIENRREHEARHDTLTGLPNRRALFELLPKAIARTKRSQVPMALLFMDLDGFKQVNDTQGHEAGDQVLCQTAERLLKCVRQTDTAVRLAGDEFTVVLENLNGGLEDAQRVAQKILAEIQKPISPGLLKPMSVSALASHYISPMPKPHPISLSAAPIAQCMTPNTPEKHRFACSNALIHYCSHSIVADVVS